MAYDDVFYILMYRFHEVFNNCAYLTVYDDILCALRKDYGLHNRPTTQAIGKIVKEFEETGVITNIERSSHHRFARSAENMKVSVL